MFSAWPHVRVFLNTAFFLSFLRVTSWDWRSHTFSGSCKLVGPQAHGHLCAIYQVSGELLGTEPECSPRTGTQSIMSPRQAVTDPGDRLRSHSMQQPQVIYFPPPGMGQGEHLQEGGTRC